MENSATLEVDSKSVKECLSTGMRVCTQAQTDGQVETIMPPVTHGMGGRGKKKKEDAP